MTCDYCGVPGCRPEICPQRLEDYHGLPGDRSEAEEAEA